MSEGEWKFFGLAVLEVVIDISNLVEAPIGQAAFRREEGEDDCQWNEGAE